MKISVFNLQKTNKHDHRQGRTFSSCFLIRNRLPLGSAEFVIEAKHKMDIMIGLSNFVGIEKYRNAAVKENNYNLKRISIDIKTQLLLLSKILLNFQSPWVKILGIFFNQTVKASAFEDFFMNVQIRRRKRRQINITLSQQSIRAIKNMFGLFISFSGFFCHFSVASYGFSPNFCLDSLLKQIKRKTFSFYPPQRTPFSLFALAFIVKSLSFILRPFSSHLFCAFKK